MPDDYLVRVGGSNLVVIEVEPPSMIIHHPCSLYAPTPRVDVRDSSLEKTLNALIDKAIPEFNRRWGINLLYWDWGIDHIEVGNLLDDDSDIWVTGDHGRTFVRFEYRTESIDLTGEPIFLVKGKPITDQTVSEFFDDAVSLELYYVGSPGCTFIERDDDVIIDHWKRRKEVRATYQSHLLRQILPNFREGYMLYLLHDAHDLELEILTVFLAEEFRHGNPVEMDVGYVVNEIIDTRDRYNGRDPLKNTPEERAIRRLDRNRLRQAFERLVHEGYLIDDGFSCGIESTDEDRRFYHRNLFFLKHRTFEGRYEDDQKAGQGYLFSFRVMVSTG